MQINTARDPLFVPDFKYTGPDPIDMKQYSEEMEVWLGQLVRALEDHLKKVYYDLSMGTVKHRLYVAIPNTGLVDEGEVVICTSGPSSIWTKVSGVMKHADLS